MSGAQWARQRAPSGRPGKQDGPRRHKACRTHWQDWISLEMQQEDTGRLHAMEDVV